MAFFNRTIMFTSESRFVRQSILECTTSSTWNYERHVLNYTKRHVLRARA